MRGIKNLTGAAEQIKRDARNLPSFAAAAHDERAEDVQGDLLDALIEIAMRLKAAGLSSEGIVRGLSEGVSELNAKEF